MNKILRNPEFNRYIKKKIPHYNPNRNFLLEILTVLNRFVSKLSTDVLYAKCDHITRTPKQH